MELESLSPPSPLRCIHRVPDRFRREREKDYTPRVISIGPYHHKNQDLKRMEVHKKWYLNCFMKRSHSKLNDYIKKIRQKEEELRQCYTETIELSQLTRDEFVTMVLVDAIFLIEFLLRFRDCHLQDKNDCIFRIPTMQYKIDCIFGIPMMRPDVQTDLLMLENQLPLFILEDLFSLYNPESGGGAKGLSIGFLLYQASCSFGVKLDKHSSQVEGQHFVDLLRNSSQVEGQHFVDLLRNLLMGPLPKEKFKGEKKSAIAPSIEKLHLAGGKIQLIHGETGETSNPNLFAIRFDDKWILKSRILKKGIPMKGILKIPKLKIEDSTEVILRNLIAFEQCSISEDPIICHYVILMDMLVDNPQDVELLVKHQIIENDLLGDDQEVPSMINRLSKGIVYNSDNFYYGDLCGKMDKFCNSNWPKYFRLLRSKYFNTPWSILSVGAAVVLLILTTIQTICSIY